MPAREEATQHELGQDGPAEMDIEAAARAALDADRSSRLLPFYAEDLVADACRSLAAMVNADGDAYWSLRTGGGLRFLREQAAEIERQAIKRGQISADIGQSLEPQQLFGSLWRRVWSDPLAIVEIDEAGTTCGRGLTFVMGDAESGWIYRSASYSGSLFVRERGPLLLSEGEEVEGTERSGYVMFRVRFRSCGWGLIRLNYFYDTDGARWVPATVAIGCEGNPVPLPVF